MTAKTPKTYHLMHPLLDVPAVATQVGYWHENGRLAGLILLFPDGQTASLTFAEMRESQVKAQVWARAEADYLASELFGRPLAGGGRLGSNQDEN